MSRLAIVAIALVILLSLLKSGVIQAILLFIIIGAVPSTSYAFSPTAMLTVFAAIGWLAALQATLMFIKLRQQQRRQYLSSYRRSPASRRARQAS